jgi:hypothetical protein
LRFDTLNIALSYGIHPIASGNFIIDILVNKIPHQLDWLKYEWQLCYHKKELEVEDEELVNP